MVWTIYRHTNRVSDKCYIGLTKATMEYRWRRGHVKDAAAGSEKPLHRAIRKYGADVFEHEVLETCDTLELANQRETWWIAAFEATNPELGYNIDDGGTSHASNPETRRKMSESRSRYLSSISDEQREKLREQGRKNRAAQMLNSTKEQRSAIGRKAYEAAAAAGVMGPGTQRARMAARSSDERKAIAAKGNAKRAETRAARMADPVEAEKIRQQLLAANAAVRNRTTEQRASTSAKLWATRHAIIAAACPAPSLRINLLRLP